MEDKKSTHPGAENLIPGGKPIGGPGAGTSPNVTFRVPIETKQRLDKRAAAAGMGTSKYIRRLIDRDLEETPDQAE